MTAADWETAGVPLPDGQPETILLANAALEWIGEHTTLDVSKELPSGAKVFVMKYIALMQQTDGITSESLAGMSQSFDTTEKDLQLLRLARELMSTYMKSDVRFVSAKGRWQ